MIEPEHPKLPVTEQCQLLGLPRSSYYHEPLPESDDNRRLMRVIDETYLACPFFGSRQMTLWLRRQGYRVNRKRVRRLMRVMGLEALSPKPKLSAANQAHRVYPYLLRDLDINRPNQVWATDITYLSCPEATPISVPSSTGPAVTCSVGNSRIRSTRASVCAPCNEPSLNTACLKS